MTRPDADLYREIIQDHDSRPRNFLEISLPTHVVEESNPLCGDRYRIAFRVSDGIIEHIGWSGRGCVLSRAATSIMTALVKGGPLDEALRLGNTFERFLAGGASGECRLPIELEAFSGVRDHPSRIGCALLPWRALKQLQKRSD